ncbi:family 10 glycosylhydrolase [Aureibacillus halotolerans]|uniref:Uncharacterized lipoprotein YddW (UPF0748 family) n=1 Tax=Aureibacillus halotolerans TaxID=1508390 RepID=A0A4R6U8G5_9BACI|nr:family 10 glycosylhydrolase [Aureibacillus halotolerans]TDQ42870.1 uncharacterized lipoprotein YddW (UPF0748 family) [Aureibacillus halotolerans]
MIDRKHLWVGLFFLLALAVAVPVASAKAITIELDNQPVTSDVSPYLTKEDVTLVPLRVIGEELGAKVGWNQANQRVTIDKGSTTMVLHHKNRQATLNGTSVTLDAPAEVRDGRMMVPLRFIGEAFGLQVNWHQNAQLITLLTGAVPEREIDDNVSVSTDMRGAWIATINGDWPSKAAQGNPAMQKQEFTTILNRLQDMGIQDVFVQVRAESDAIYPSAYAPWNKVLTGTQGKNPGYDPLDFMISETHKKGMKFHAWFNPFRASASVGSQLASSHVAKQHPEWIVSASNKMYINPGIPAARQHIIQAISEVVKNYDVDGVHLDDYFYPSHVRFNDDAANVLHNTRSMTTADWRRDNINQFVKNLGESIHSIKPEVSYGISPFGVWRNQSDDPTGSATRAGVPTYDAMYADVRTWVKNEWIDYVAPQLYWSIGFEPAAYDVLAQWWANEVEGTDVKLYIGHAPYKIGTSEAGWGSAQQIIDQLTYNEKIPEIDGSIFFSSQYLMNPFNSIERLLTSYY